MDEEDYDESIAFPLLKPNIDVFGLPPPARKRRRRGWYQRKRRPPTDGKEVVRWTRAATGADVPQELFDNVLRYMELNWWLSDDEVRESKRELGQISLVCRRWAKLIRPMIFEKLELKNRDDAVTLLGFVRCPTSVISGYINEFDLKLSVASYPYTPWIHTVCFLILPRLPTKPDMAIPLIVEGPLPPNKVMTGIHDMVPPTYPHCSSRIAYLKLYDVRFKSFVDIMRTIGDMPDLKRVDLQKVTWDRSTDEEFRPPPARRPRFQRHPHYQMRQCTDGAAVVFLRLLLCPGSDRLDELDADLLFRTISALSVSSGSDYVSCYYDFQLGPDTFSIYVQRLGGGSPQEGSFGYSHVLEACVILTPHAEGQPRRIRAVAFHLSSHASDLNKCVGLDWEEVDKLIASLSALETLLFFQWNGDEVLRAHRDVIVQKMAHFKNSHKLKYAQFTPSDHWAQVTCADDGTIKRIGPRYKGRYGWKHFT